MNTTENKPLSLIAILALLTAVVVLAWGAVMLVHYIPTGFATLADIAENLTDRSDDTLTTTTNHALVTSGDPVEISWSTLQTEGTYTFKYDCSEGVVLEVKSANGMFEEVSCDNPYTLPTDTNTLTLLASGLDERFKEVSYSLTFTPARTTKKTQVATALFTIVNPYIPIDGLATTSATPEMATEPIVDATAVYTGLRAEDLPTDESASLTTDLAVSIDAVGVRSGDTVRTDANTPQAILITVRNNGTQTIGSWTLTADVAGERIVRNTPAVLEQGDGARFTLDIPAYTHKGAVARVAVTTSNDANHNNNVAEVSITHTQQ